MLQCGDICVTIYRNIYIYIYIYTVYTVPLGWPRKKASQSSVQFTTDFPLENKNFLSSYPVAYFDAKFIQWQNIPWISLFPDAMEVIKDKMKLINCINFPSRKIVISSAQSHKRRT